jgi:phosphoribosylaminoimidazole-succinocarboxamide synthase
LTKFTHRILLVIFYAEGYQERQNSGEEQKQLSKEFVRRWLIENGFQGLEGQQILI